MPRIYVATPKEIAERMNASAGGRGDIILYENHTWGPRAAGRGTIEKLPEEWINICRAIVRNVSDLRENSLTEESKMETEKKNYVSGIFDKYKIEKNLDLWQGFPELMWAMGFEMDCENSFNEYRGKSKLKLNEAHSEREEKRNILYLLEHADRQIVGNYLFSHWRYYTHWAYGYSEYDIDFLRRIIDILEQKYKVEDKR